MTTSSVETGTVSTRSQRWAQRLLDRLEQWPAAARRALTVSITVLCGLLALVIITVPFELYSQCIFALCCFIAALVLRKIPGRLTVIILIGLSLTASLRYLYWRLTSTLGFEGWVDMLFGYGLVMAELYAMIVLIFGYLQTAWPLRRPEWCAASVRRSRRPGAASRSVRRSVTAVPRRPHR